MPHLVRDDGVGMEESGLICAYLDHLDGAPAFAWPPGARGWELRRLEALARSLIVAAGTAVMLALALNAVGALWTPAYAVYYFGVLWQLGFAAFQFVRIIFVRPGSGSAP